MAAPDPGLAIPASPLRSYRGRFAPSPTGPLHIGSITAALASYLDARAAGGCWLVRMEDLDPPREAAGAASDILRTLEKLGLHWDEGVVYQSQRLAAYEEALATLQANELIYACRCSRQDLAGADIYPGTCRSLHLKPDSTTALRCKVPMRVMGCIDRLQGELMQQLDHDVGDFILRRRDGYFAYQLAVVVDDGWQGITDIVRGIDLLDSTPRQLFLQQQLRLPTPRYAHIPVIINEAGQKLGKQQFAEAVDSTDAAAVLVSALGYLQQNPDLQLLRESTTNILEWAIANWQPGDLAGLRELPEHSLKPD
ncbi:MAG: tRNA glutamyl-Q(34) synthetase GluQRS [Pseudomonadota bacterium]